MIQRSCVFYIYCNCLGCVHSKLGHPVSFCSASHMVTVGVVSPGCAELCSKFQGHIAYGKWSIASVISHAKTKNHSFGGLGVVSSKKRLRTAHVLIRVQLVRWCLLMECLTADVHWTNSFACAWDLWICWGWQTAKCGRMVFPAKSYLTHIQSIGTNQ